MGVTQQDWAGVFPAATTQLKSDQSLDLEATAKHVSHLIDCGVHGLIMLGTVGENTVLAAEEKEAVLKCAIEAAGGRVPVLSGVAENSTAAACRFAAHGQQLGLDGLMVLPAMVYKSDPRETLSHFRSVAKASDLPIMVYNNPPAYGVDVTPEMFMELGDEATILAIKESSDDPRRLTDIINVCGKRYILFGGVDDLALEALFLGATGWVAGLVNAFPRETVRLYELASEQRWEEARELYRWFTPLLHLDIGSKLVQYIKLAQAMVGLGTETVRAPRMALVGAERERVIGIIQTALEAQAAEAAE